MKTQKLTPQQQLIVSYLAEQDGFDPDLILLKKVPPGHRLRVFLGSIEPHLSYFILLQAQDCYRIIAVCDNSDAFYRINRPSATIPKTLRGSTADWLHYIYPDDDFFTLQTPNSISDCLKGKNAHSFPPYMVNPVQHKFVDGFIQQTVITPKTKSDDSVESVDVSTSSSTSTSGVSLGAENNSHTKTLDDLATELGVTKNSLFFLSIRRRIRLFLSTKDQDQNLQAFAVLKASEQSNSILIAAITYDNSLHYFYKPSETTASHLRGKTKQWLDYIDSVNDAFVIKNQEAFLAFISTPYCNNISFPTYMINPDQYSYHGELSIQIPSQLNLNKAKRPASAISDEEFIKDSDSVAEEPPSPMPPALKRPKTGTFFPSAGAVAHSDSVDIPSARPPSPSSNSYSSRWSDYYNGQVSFLLLDKEEEENDPFSQPYSVKSPST